MDIEPVFYQNCTEEQLIARVKELLETTKGRRYIMANSDSCPPPWNSENSVGFEAVSKVISIGNQGLCK